MIRKATVVILLVAIFAAAALTPASDALAATRYDGAWSLVIYTRSGPCDQSYRLSGQIVNGVIVYDGIGANVTVPAGPTIAPRSCPLEPSISTWRRPDAPGGRWIVTWRTVRW